MENNALLLVLTALAFVIALLLFGLLLVGMKLLRHAAAHRERSVENRLPDQKAVADQISSAYPELPKDRNTTEIQAAPDVATATNHVSPASTETQQSKSTAPALIVTPAKANISAAPKLSRDQDWALERLRSDAPAIFLTGAAGTGKSFVLRQFVQEFAGRCVVLAPTGMAALNAGGQTIHSFFRLPPKTINPEDIKVVENQVLYRKADVIIIDEVSMVRADIMDAIDVFLRKNGRDSKQPFGGTRIIFVGDLHQLPPVVRGKEEERFLSERYGSPFFYSAPVFDQLAVEILELRQVQRQSDADFISALNAVRSNNINDEQLNWLNGMTGKASTGGIAAVTLTTTRSAASAVNLDRLAKLNGDQREFEAIFEGDISAKDDDGLKLPVDAVLRLKPGAQVMFVKNDLNGRWVNGTLGHVSSVGDELLTVTVGDGSGGERLVTVERERWSKVRYEYSSTNKRIESRETGAVVQYPVILAWAVTIHKSQGATYDYVNVDLSGGTFAGGQAYVALSRCRTPEGLRLLKPLQRTDVKLDPRLAGWQNQLIRGRNVAFAANGGRRTLSSESPTS